MTQGREVNVANFGCEVRYLECSFRLFLRLFEENYAQMELCVVQEGIMISAFLLIIFLLRAAFGYSGVGL